MCADRGPRQTAFVSSRTSAFTASGFTVHGITLRADGFAAFRSVASIAAGALTSTSNVCRAGNSSDSVLPRVSWGDVQA